MTRDDIIAIATREFQRPIPSPNKHACYAVIKALTAAGEYGTTYTPESLAEILRPVIGCTVIPGREPVV